VCYCGNVCLWVIFVAKRVYGCSSIIFFKEIIDTVLFLTEIKFKFIFSKQKPYEQFSKQNNFKINIFTCLFLFYYQMFQYLVKLRKYQVSIKQLILQ
jgi:hypothetical protein